jgi:phosphoribosylanthranilate isomerase
VWTVTPGTPRIKFCGITRPEDADFAVSLGAWAVGMILWAGSDRVVLPQEAADIAGAVGKRAEVAGVFVNPELDELTELADLVGLTMVQLHGQEGPRFCGEAARRTGCKVIKVARVHDRADIQALTPFHTDFHLLDTFVKGRPGGTGATFNWELAAGRRAKSLPPLILSGGLTPENVGEAIQIVRPYGVDVASGVESAPGVKDHERMRAFAAAVADSVSLVSG